MKTLYTTLFSVLLVFAVQSTAFTQSNSLSETFKKSFDKTVQKVENTDEAAAKRILLNDSFSKMLKVIDHIESETNLSEEESAVLASYKSEIQDKKNELNGVDGFDRVMDKNLNNFSDYSQQYFEQANKTVTIGLTTALLIILILILL